MYSNVASDLIFPSFIASATIDVSKKKVIKDIDQMKSDDKKGVLISNVGGWQSHGISGKAPDKFEYLNKVYDGIVAFAHDYISGKDKRMSIDSGYWWVNQNDPGNYNTVHNHGMADLIGVYYAKTENTTGSFCILRNDHTSYLDHLYHCAWLGDDSMPIELQSSFLMNPEPGRFYFMPGHLWHFVRPNLTKKRRLSISFNFNVFNNDLTSA